MGAGGTITANGSAGDDIFGAAGASLGNFASTVDGGAGADAIYTGTGIDTVNGGAGNDTIDVSSGVGDSVDGGAGNDRVVISANANLTATDSYVGGEGTDTIAFTAQIADAAGTYSAFSGFEVFEVAPGLPIPSQCQTSSTLRTILRIDFGDGGNAAVGTTNVSSSVTGVRLITGSTGGEIITFDRLVDTTTSALDVSVRLAGTVTEFIANDEESVTISGSTAAMDVVFTDLTLQDATSLTISGANDITTTNNIDATILATVDASGSSGAVDLDAGDSAVAMTATAGSGAFSFEGGSGSDTITGGASGDTQ